MLLSRPFIYSLYFLISFASAKPAPAPISLPRPALILPSLTPSNHTSAPLELLNETTQANTSTTHLTTPVFQCDQQRFGVGLNLSSCQNALAKIGQDPAPLIFGMRGPYDQPSKHWDVVLPHRIFSDDGLCAIDLALKPLDENQEISTWREVWLAANSLIHLCVQGGPPSEGGHVAGLGLTHLLDVVVSDYRPDHIHCIDPVFMPPGAIVPSFDSCKTIMDEMSWSWTSTEFAPWSYREASSDVRLPNAITSADGKCRLWIRIDGTRPDTTSWSELWLSSIALSDMCLRRGWTGIADKLGDRESLRIMFVAPSDASQGEELSNLSVA